MRTHSHKNAIAQALATTIALTRKGRLSRREADQMIAQLCHLWEVATCPLADLPPCREDRDYAPRGVQDILRHYADWQQHRSFGSR